MSGFFKMIFFTMAKMFKYNMVNSEKCREEKSYRHVLWECTETRRVWQEYRECMIYIRQSNKKVLSYNIRCVCNWRFWSGR
jgi:hypothetical protein